MTQPTNSGTGGAPRSGPNKVLIIVLVVAGVVVLGCCGIFTTCMLVARHAAQTVQEAVKEDMRSKGMSVSGVTERGTAAKLPDNFPSDVPVYSGLKAVVSMSDKAHDGGVVTFMASGKAGGDIVKFYQKELPAQSWTEDTVTAMGEMTTMAYSKSGRTVTLMVMPSDKDTTVQITYSKK